jgi:O-antigen/teichoic acid export membrane protein
MKTTPAHAPARGSPSSDHRLITRNAASAYGVRGLLGLSALFLTPYLFRRLGLAGFGTWSVIFTISTVFDFLQVGFSTGVSKHVAELRALSRRAEVERVLGAAVLTLVGLGLVALLVSLAVAALARGLAAGGEAEAFAVGMAVVGIATLIHCPLVAYAAALRGYQRFDLTNLALAVGIAVFSIGTMVAVEAGGGVVGVAVAYAAALVIEGLLYCLLLRRLDSSLRPRLRRSNRPTWRRVTGFSSYVLLAESMGFIGQRMDTVVISAIRSAAAAAPYAAALKLLSGLQSVTLPVVHLLMPMVSDLSAREREDEVSRRYRILVRAALQATLPVAAALAIFSQDVVDVWLGDTAPSDTARIIVVLMLAGTVTLPTAPAAEVLIGLGRARTLGILAVLEGVANLLVSVVLVWKYGAIGAAVGTLLTAGLFAPVKLRLASRALDEEPWRLLAPGLGAGILSSAPGVAVMIIAWASLPEGVVRLVAGAGAGIIVSLAIAVLQIGPRRVLAFLQRFLAEARQEDPVTAEHTEPLAAAAVADRRSG